MRRSMSGAGSTHHIERVVQRLACERELRRADVFEIITHVSAPVGILLHRGRRISRRKWVKIGGYRGLRRDRVAVVRRLVVGGQGHAGG